MLDLGLVALAAQDLKVGRTASVPSLHEGWADGAAAVLHLDMLDDALFGAADVVARHASHARPYGHDADGLGVGVGHAGYRVTHR